jgi:phosphoglycolate phosphatase
MIQKRKIKHVMWDWNGTLMDDTELNVEIINPILARHGGPALTLDRYRNIIDFPIKVFYTRLGLNENVIPYEQFVDEFCEVYEGRRFECDLFVQVIETLEALYL